MNENIVMSDKQDDVSEKTKITETELLVEAIYQRYGYDFRHYQQSTVRNRFEKHRVDSGLDHISEMIPKVLYDYEYFNALVLDMSVTVTEMFRDPMVFNVLKQDVIPSLMTYPYINIWHAGCATGEEVYSMAIFLKESGILHRAQLYGTDINDDSIQFAKKGIYPLQQMKKYSKSYNLSGGVDSLSAYYRTNQNSAKINRELCKQITFAQHSLVTDGVFAETHLVVCKNVLIYFNKELQNAVLRLFADSLCNRGYLCLGDSESLEFSVVSDQFEVVNEKAKIYRKKTQFN